MRTLVCDMQFGSTGKGLLAGYLARILRPELVISAWGPNAGHTYIDPEGRKMVTTMVPIGSVSPDCEVVAIGPGAAINVTNLLNEWRTYKKLGMIGENAHLMVHPSAAVIDELNDAQSEQANGLVSIGSTMKGTAMAQVRKMMRYSTPDVINIAKEDERLADFLVTKEVWKQVMMDYIGHTQIEGAQGYSLSMHHGFYPYVTSRDTSTYQILADCGIPASFERPVVWGTMRTFPIRVANRFNAEGQMIGTSGPCYDDQKELDWKKDLGMEPELTTVTKLPRRIFSFSMQQVLEAKDMMGCDHYFLNFCNYLKNEEVRELVDDLDFVGIRPTLFGYGPADGDVWNNVK